jgi:hypothetical protein
MEEEYDERRDTRLPQEAIEEQNAILLSDSHLVRAVSGSRVIQANP